MRFHHILILVSTVFSISCTSMKTKEQVSQGFLNKRNIAEAPRTKISAQDAYNELTGHEKAFQGDAGYPSSNVYGVVISSMKVTNGDLYVQVSRSPGSGFGYWARCWDQISLNKPIKGIPAGGSTTFVIHGDDLYKVETADNGSSTKYIFAVRSQAPRQGGEYFSFDFVEKDSQLVPYDMSIQDDDTDDNADNINGFQCGGWGGK
jgi:hypothetical protein